MAKTLEQSEKEKVHVAEVVRHGEAITLPEGMKISDAIKTLQAKQQYEEQAINIRHKFDAFVWDGAYALAKALQRKYGWAQAVSTHGWMGVEPPTLMAVDTGVNESIQVPWGTFQVPGIKGKFQTSYEMDPQKGIVFVLMVNTLRMYENEVEVLAKEIKKILKDESIYRGKAVAVKFTDEDNEILPLPEPKFIDLSGVQEENLVFPEDVDNAIRTNLFTPIERYEEAKRLGIPIKRGVLLAGDFGVGKTLTAYVAAQKAIANKITFIYCQKPSEFEQVMRFATQYSPALVFCEDIDRMVYQDRDASVDRIINVIDGIDTKNFEVITVLTTNEVGNVNQALLRPGRMDAVIHVARPDAQAVARLVKQYLRELLDPEADLTDVSKLLNDSIPAIIREVCERSKLSMLRLTPKGQKINYITTPALLDAAKTMKMQLNLLAPKDKAKTDVEVVANAFVSNFVEAAKKTAKLQSVKNLQLHESNGNLSAVYEEVEA